MSRDKRVDRVQIIPVFTLISQKLCRSITAKKINEKTDTTEDRINRGKRPIEGDREAHTAKQSASGEGERERSWLRVSAR